MNKGSTQAGGTLEHLTFYSWQSYTRGDRDRVDGENLNDGFKPVPVKDKERLRFQDIGKQSRSPAHQHPLVVGPLREVVGGANTHNARQSNDEGSSSTHSLVIILSPLIIIIVLFPLIMVIINAIDGSFCRSVIEEGGTIKW